MTRAWTPEDSLLPTDWAQRSVYRTPLLATTIEELTGRISQWSTDDCVVLRSWSDATVDVAALLAAVTRSGARYGISRTVSETPIETGYIECMRLLPTPPEPEGDDAAIVIAAFVAEQRARYPDIERWLVEHYGTLTEERAKDPRFHYIDYPGFDSGNADLGFGLLVQARRYEATQIWCWSRVVHFHK